MVSEGVAKVGSKKLGDMSPKKSRFFNCFPKNDLNAIISHKITSTLFGIVGRGLFFLTTKIENTKQNVYFLWSPRQRESCGPPRGDKGTYQRLGFLS